MRNNVLTLLEQAQQKMSGYAALMNYRFQNLSVKAEPVALLSVSVMIQGSEAKIEDVAQVRMAPDRDDQFEIYPKDNAFLIPIAKGLFEVHPEYKIDMPQMEGSDDPEERFILATMPEVDDFRHDLMMDVVSTLSDACDAQLEATFATSTAKIVAQLATGTPEELDEARKALEDTHNQHKDLCKQFREAKEQQIEEAYQEYQAKQAAAKEKKAEEEAAHNQQAGLRMNWNPMADE